ncbi:SulP family inorganic anion transporter [Microlunatus endophyticus]|uniref:SulP family inorganic anion transporter n=1 Tax=Microlunatus endophyticus TaxID=1716077 RepID=UPI001E2F183A|nr:SulP family inorganic anion transporter [Microlunatus endophyticus]
MGRRTAIGAWRRSLRPERRNLRADVVAGIPNAITNIPDGMASAVLAGINPVHGLYASLAGPLIGGLGVSTRLMVISTTGAGSVSTGSAVAGVSVQDRAATVAVLTLLAGAFMIIAGIFRLGRYTRFVSQSVMLGFLTGIAVNIVLGQLSDLTGAPVAGGTTVTRAIGVLAHPGRWDAASVGAGLVALLLLVLVNRTRASLAGSLVAIAVPTVVVVLVGWHTVARVGDAGEVAHGLPVPRLPELARFSPELLADAAALAAIILVQGAIVSQAAPNQETRADPSQDFTAQGAANVVSGLVAGMPVGASVGQTALNVASGARSRWAVIWGSVWMTAIMVGCWWLMRYVVVPTLAAILIYAAVTSLRQRELTTILRTGWNSRIALVATFLATLFLPVAVAVGIGVILSLVLQLNQEAIDLRGVRLVPEESGRFIETRSPARLPDRTVTILDIYGSLFYAGSRTLEARLPDPRGSVRPVVVLRLRGRTTLGSTFFAVISDYADRIEAAGGRLYLTGIAPELAAQIRQPGHRELTGNALLYASSPVVGASTLEAYNDATTWLVDPRH